MASHVCFLLQWQQTKGIHKYIHMVASDDAGFFVLVHSDAFLARCHALDNNRLI